METIKDGTKLKTVAVIGGAGHVGLPFCLVLANSNFMVYGIDIAENVNKKVMKGKLPFIEESGEEYLKRALQKGSLQMSNDVSVIRKADVIVVTMGTPVDRSLNPNIEDLLNCIEDIHQYLKKGQLIILRSTLYPGTTEIIKRAINKHKRYVVGKDIFLVCAPERVAQGKAITELRSLPQLIGAFDDKSYEMAMEFFGQFLENKCFKLAPIEAELGKLFTNMFRYTQFALANEFYLIADSFGANINLIINSVNYDYPRMNMPIPGPNVGGPCLYKDGWFLLERFPFNEMISAAFRINEGMTMQIVTHLEKLPNIAKVAILGMTFKAGSDDTRNSLSFKLKNQLIRNGYDVIMVDPYVEGYEDMSLIRGCNAVVLMTPHSQFKDIQLIINRVANNDCIFVDIWGFWDEMKYKSRNGYFIAKELLSP